MFTHLLVFLVLHAGFAQPPEMHDVAPLESKQFNEWPSEKAVVATVHGVSQQAPHSGRSCVYVEWAVGRRMTKKGKDTWVSFVHPTASREELVFRAEGKDPLRVHPSIVRFFLPPSLERAAKEIDFPVPPGTDSLTVKEYCLREGEVVSVRRTQGVHLLPPDAGTETPKEQVYERLTVTSTENQSEATPTSMLR